MISSTLAVLLLLSWSQRLPSAEAVRADTQPFRGSYFGTFAREEPLQVPRDDVDGFVLAGSDSKSSSSVSSSSGNAILCVCSAHRTQNDGHFNVTGLLGFMHDDRVGERYALDGRLVCDDDAKACKLRTPGTGGADIELAVDARALAAKGGGGPKESASAASPDIATFRVVPSDGAGPIHSGYLGSKLSVLDSLCDDVACRSTPATATRSSVRQAPTTPAEEKEEKEEKEEEKEKEEEGDEGSPTRTKGGSDGASPPNVGGGRACGGHSGRPDCGPMGYCQASPLPSPPKEGGEGGGKLPGALRPSRAAAQQISVSLEGEEKEGREEEEEEEEACFFNCARRGFCTCNPGACFDDAGRCTVAATYPQANGYAAACLPPKPSPQAHEPSLASPAPNPQRPPPHPPSLPFSAGLDGARPPNAVGGVRCGGEEGGGGRPDCGDRGFCLEAHTGTPCWWDCAPGFCSCDAGACFDADGLCTRAASYPEKSNYQATCDISNVPHGGPQQGKEEEESEEGEEGKEAPKPKRKIYSAGLDGASPPNEVGTRPCGGEEGGEGREGRGKGRPDCGPRAYCLERDTGTPCWWDCAPGFCSCDAGACFDADGLCTLYPTYPQPNEYQAACPLPPPSPSPSPPLSPSPPSPSPPSPSPSPSLTDVMGVTGGKGKEGEGGGVDGADPPNAVGARRCGGVGGGGGSPGCGPQGFCQEEGTGAACWWDCFPGVCSCTAGTCFDEGGRCFDENKATYPEANGYKATCEY